MNQKTISFDRRKARHSDLVKLRDQGYRVICPLCKADIFFSENAGSWCSKNPNHYEAHIYKKSVRDKLRAISNKFGKTEAIANMKKKGYTQEQIQEHIAQYYPDVD